MREQNKKPHRIAPTGKECRTSIADSLDIVGFGLAVGLAAIEVLIMLQMAGWA